MKKKNVIEIRYSRAMRLWSVVSSHDLRPYSLVQVILAFADCRVDCSSHTHCT